MKKLLLVILAASLTVAAQGKGGTRGGPPAGAGPGVSSGSGTSHRPDTSGTHGRPDTATKPAHDDHRKSGEQQALKDSQTNSGSFKMLEDKTGKSSDELKAMYAASGARNYGQFVSAVVVSKNLGLDTTAVLDGLKTKSLGETLKDMGVSETQAKAEVKKAEAEVKAAKRKNP
jgi:hypothetical protein